MNKKHFLYRICIVMYMSRSFYIIIFILFVALDILKCFYPPSYPIYTSVCLISGWVSLLTLCDICSVVGSPNFTVIL